MANDHHVRIILEAVDKGSTNLRKFFKDGDKDIQAFRKSLREANDEINLLFTSGGVRGRGPSGRFLPVGDVEKAIVQVKILREEARKLASDNSVGKFFSAFRQGSEENKRIREIFQDRVNLSKEAAQKERDELDKIRRQGRLDLDKAHFEERQELERVELAEIKIQAAGNIRKLRDQANYYQDRIDARRKAAVKEGFVVSQVEESADRKEAQRLRAAIIRDEERRDSLIRALKEEQREKEKIERGEFDAETRRKRREVSAPDVAKIFADARREIQATSEDMDKLDSRFTRFGRNAGRNISQFRTAIALGRQELSQADRDFLRTEGRLTRLGVAFGQATRGANNFVNVRWAIVVSFLQVLLTLLIQFGLALVALASSAIQAAGALGGVLLASIAQLIPAVGLLAAAFSRLGVVMDAVKLAEKIDLSRVSDAKDKMDEITQATDRLADARLALVKAAEAVKDAEYDIAQAALEVKDAIKDQKDAVEDLAEARRQAARDIVDANLDERDAALSLEEAELAVLEAKRKLREEEQKTQLQAGNIADAEAAVREAQDRLKQVRSEGDEAQIAVALQQLEEAQLNLQTVKTDAQETQNDIRQAQNDVRQAELQRDEATIRNKRAQEDAAQARQKGVEGSERVQQAEENLANATRRVAQAERSQVLAQRALRDSIHALAVAKKNEQQAEEDLTESQKKQTTQQEQLQEQLADLSPAERKLFQSLRKMRKAYEDNFRPITDVIIAAFARAVDRAVVLLQDPQILTAARKLAQSIGSSIDAVSEFTVSPEFRRFLVFTIEQAAKNVPKITDAFINLFRVLMRIAQAATPLFNRLLDRFEKFAERLENRSRNTRGLERFFATAGRHLDSWIRFGGAVARILGLIVRLSAPTGKGLLDDLTNKLNEWSDWLDDNEARVLNFFKNVGATVRALARTLGAALTVLFEAFTSEDQAALTEFIFEVLLPAFTLFLKILGILAKIFNTIAEIPFLGDILKFVATMLIVEKLFNRLIPVTQKLTNVFVSLIKKIFSAQTAASIAGFARNMRILFTLMRGGTPILVALEATFPKLAAGIRLVGAALKFIFITNPWIAVIAGIIAAIVLLDRKFHFIAPTIKFIGKLFRDIFEWVKKNWKLLIAILLFPFGAVAYAVFKWRDKIIGFIKYIIDWVVKNWKTLLIAAMIAPFAIGGLIILALIKFSARVRGFFTNLISDIVKAFEKLPGKILGIVRKIPGLIKQALSGLPGVVEGVIRAALPGPLEKRIFGNEKDPADRQREANQDKKKFLAALKPAARARAQKLSGRGKTYLEVVQTLIGEGLLGQKDVDILQRLNIVSSNEFARGGTVPGGTGQPVPIIAHAGEWVLNIEQQQKVARAMRTTLQQAKNIIFGSAMGANAQSNAKKLPDASGAKPYSGTTGVYGNRMTFNLVPKTDPYGAVVWFIEMADGTFGQVNPRDAKKIIATQGRFIPKYVKRSTHGFKQNIIPFGIERAMGGLVPNIGNLPLLNTFKAANVQSFAEGGTVLSTGGIGAPTNTTNKNINQHFEVKTEGETDWNYVLRLGAIHAQAGY